MTAVIAVFNAGSSSLKFSLFRQADLSLMHKGAVDVPDTADGQKTALQTALTWLSSHEDGLQLKMAGHRVVHGKNRAAPVRITPGIVAELKTLIPLAPLHQPHNLRIIEELLVLHPDLPQIACFDTAFHRTQPQLSSMFALPKHFYDEGIKRYGFHGISYEYIASELPKYTKNYGRVIVAHLGNGATLCAMQDLKSVGNSMGFSTLDGLMMGTRCGTLDAGAVLYLQQHLGMSAEEITQLLYHESGLLGVSGISHDMRTLEENNSPAANEAIQLFCHMAAQHMGALMATLGGLDALVFTGGIGEHSARVRAGICAYFSWAGISLEKNSPIPVYVIPTNEELVIARACQGA